MEATQVIHTNGDVENTITLSPEESNAVLNRLDPNLRAVVEEQLSQQVESSVSTQISDEEFERILDEAVGITPQNTTENIISEDTTPISQEETNNIAHIGEGLLTQIENTTPITTTEESFDVVRPVEYEEIPEPFDNPVPIVQESLAPIEFNQLNTNFTSDVTSRFSGAEWYDKIHSKTVTLAGCGGIGSWLALLLARTNIGYLRLYDDDKVETGNLSGQLFSRDNVGDFKVWAVSDIARNFSDYYRINTHERRFCSSDEVSDVMMCGFDNMEARKTYFRAWKDHLLEVSNKSECLLLDGRLSAECLQVYCIQGDDDSAIQYYEEHCLFSDEEADETVCSYKQTSFMANMIAGMMVNVFVNWCANLAGGFRPVPVFTEYDAVTMQMKIKMNVND